MWGGEVKATSGGGGNETEGRVIRSGLGVWDGAESSPAFC